MHTDAAKLTSILVSFLLVMTRIGGAVVFVPIPGMRAYPEVPKALLVLAATVSLCRYWIVAASPQDWTPMSLAAAILSEAAFGLVVGVGVSLLIEAAQVAGQLISLQAGFSYASTIDPSSDVDSGIVLILCQLLTSLTFFSLGLDRAILQGFGDSFERIPPGSYHLQLPAAEAIARLGSGMFQMAFRLALPLTAVLLIADIALALAGRFLQQLQLSTVLFPVKTLGALAMLALAAGTSGKLIAQWLVDGWQVIHQAAGF
jgi:flagellar biosynthesis protein FliR